ncbi:MAG: hypothetical protein WAT21_06800 [Saprospiraceae bacterium]
MIQEDVIIAFQKEILAYQKQNAEYQKENEYLRNELAQLKRLIFGKKSERFVSFESPMPLNSLFALDELPENKIENLTEVVSHKREKPEVKKGGRKELPSHFGTRNYCD